MSASMQRIAVDFRILGSFQHLRMQKWSRVRHNPKLDQLPFISLVWLLQ
jgi:hypothetical protein